MKFYYNSELNICAEEPWVVDYLYYDGAVNSREEALEELRAKREFYSWFDCEVSNTIAECFIYQRKIIIFLFLLDVSRLNIYQKFS